MCNDNNSNPIGSGNSSNINRNNNKLAVEKLNLLLLLMFNDTKYNDKLKLDHSFLGGLDLVCVWPNIHKCNDDLLHF